LHRCVSAAAESRKTSIPKGVRGRRGELGRGKEGFGKVLRSHLRRARRGGLGRSEERIQEALVLLLFRKVQTGVRARRGADPHAGGGQGRRALHAWQGEVGTRLRRRFRGSLRDRSAFRPAAGRALVAKGRKFGRRQSPKNWRPAVQGGRGSPNSRTPVFSRRSGVGAPEGGGIFTSDAVTGTGTATRAHSELVCQTHPLRCSPGTPSFMSDRGTRSESLKYDQRLRF